MMRILLALAYPVCCMVVLYVVLLSCDDHQFDLWEQMDEVLVANKGMVIPLLSHLGWSYFLHVFFRATAHVSPYVSLPYTLCQTCIWFSFDIVVCPVCRGCVKDPKTTLHCYLCVTFPLILRFKLNGALQHVQNMN